MTFVAFAFSAAVPCSCWLQEMVARQSRAGLTWPPSQVVFLSDLWPSLTRLVWFCHQHVLCKMSSEMTLTTLAGIRATNRNVNRPWSCLTLGIRRWELHHKNRLVALRTKIKVRNSNSLILKGKCRVWCEADGFRKVFRTFLKPNFGFGSWDFARIEIF